MSDETTDPEAIRDDEIVARFIVASNWVRNSDSSVKPDAFIPYPYPDLSVTRHIGLSATEIWQLGDDVAKLRSRTLYGRADLAVTEIVKLSLTIAPTKTPRNHANIQSWPADKPAQKAIAQLLAAASNYLERPTED